jgi:hypothetical protein
MNLAVFMMITSPVKVSFCWRLNGRRQRIPVFVQQMALAASTVAAPKHTSLEDKFLSHWRSMKVHPKSTILLTVSGGSDSVAMLHLMQLLKIRQCPNLDLKVVYYNHKVRPAADQEVYIPCYLKHFIKNTLYL